MKVFVGSFLNSVRGLTLAAHSERSVRQELVVGAVALPMALLISDQIWTRVTLIGVLLFVLATELLNTAIETLADHVTPEHHPAIGAVKDLASAAVFCALSLALLVWTAALADLAMGARP